MARIDFQHNLPAHGCFHAATHNQFSLFYGYGPLGLPPIKRGDSVVLKSGEYLVLQVEYSGIDDYFTLICTMNPKIFFPRKVFERWIFPFVPSPSSSEASRV